MENILNTDYCVYLHERKDKPGHIFYIGRGNLSNKRPYNYSNRNNYWKSIVNKHGYNIIIIEKNLTDLESKIKEIYYIEKYKSLGMAEANFTKGGDGCLGYKHSEEDLIRMRESGKGKHNHHGINNPRYGSSGRILNILTGEIFESLSSAAESVNRKITTVCDHLNGRSVSSTSNTVLEYLDKTPQRSRSDFKIILCKHRKVKSVILIHKDNLKLYESEKYEILDYQLK